MTAVTPAQITRDAMDVIRHTGKCIEEALKGRSVRVTSDHNGQPYGRSRKSWKGEVACIVFVHIDVLEGISLGLKGHEYGECFIRADEVEFV